MIFHTKHKRCKTCAYFDSEWKNAGICRKLGVLPKRGEYIVDGLEIFDKLHVEPIEYRNPVVRNDFSCIYWKERER